SQAQFKNDFVELFNAGTEPASLDGWSVQYASATGTGTFAQNSPVPLAGTLAPGQYYLVQQGAGTGAAPALPTPDATGSVNMSATAGKVVLVDQAAGLACNSASSCDAIGATAHIRDLIGYGN